MKEHSAPLGYDTYLLGWDGTPVDSTGRWMKVIQDECAVFGLSPTKVIDWRTFYEQ